MSGPIPVFVQADDSAVEAAVVEALVRQGCISPVDAPDRASWIVLTTSGGHNGDRSTPPRVVAFVTSMDTPGSCHVVGPALAALATGLPAAPALPRNGVNLLGSALVRTSGRASELTPREEAVLRLIAKGHTTAEVAAELSYSERSIKNVIHGVTERLALRNRCQLVAHALREGWI